LVKRVAREKENTEKRLKVEKGQKGRAREEEKLGDQRLLD
jgi:hypothetical protein